MSKKVLVVDDDKDLAQFLLHRCRDWGLSVRAAHDALSALTTIHAWRPDLVCLDVTLPGGNGISVCEMLSTDQQLCRIPVVILTGRTDEDVVRRCHALCAYYVTKCEAVWPRIEPLLIDLLDLKKAPHSPTCEASQPQVAAAPLTSAPAVDSAENCRLVDLVFDLLAGDSTLLEQNEVRPSDNSTLRHFRSAPPWVLHIDDDDDFSRAVKMRLEQHGIAVIRACNGMLGFRSAFTDPADAIILDYNMPNGQGDYILRRLKETSLTRSIPVVVLTGDTNRSLERTMLNLGAEAVLHKPLKFEQLIGVLRQHIDVLPVAST